MTIFDPVLRALEHGIVLREEYLSPVRPIDRALRSGLMRFDPKVIVHRGGNGPSRFHRSLDAGASIFETDVHWRRGSLVIGHEHWAGPIAFDTTRRLLRLDPFARPLTRLLDDAVQHDCTLMLDLILGTPTRVAPLVSQLLRYNLEAKTWFTGQWPVLDAIAMALPVPIRYYGVNKPSRLQRFMNEQPATKRPGISLNKRLATPEMVEMLHGLKVDVVVYTVTSPLEALHLLQAGVDGLITNDLSLVALFGKGSGR